MPTLNSPVRVRRPDWRRISSRTPPHSPIGEPFFVGLLGLMQADNALITENSLLANLAPAKQVVRNGRGIQLVNACQKPKVDAAPTKVERKSLLALQRAVGGERSENFAPQVPGPALSIKVAHQQWERATQKHTTTRPILIQFTGVEANQLFTTTTSICNYKASEWKKSPETSVSSWSLVAHFIYINLACVPRECKLAAALWWARRRFNEFFGVRPQNDK